MSTSYRDVNTFSFFFMFVCPTYISSQNSRLSLNSPGGDSGGYFTVVCVKCIYYLT